MKGKTVHELSKLSKKELFKEIESKSKDNNSSSDDFNSGPTLKEQFKKFNDFKVTDKDVKNILEASNKFV